MDPNAVPVSLDDDAYERAISRFQRRCVAFGTTTIALVLIWALTGGTVHSSGQGDIQIGLGFWPIWFIVFGGLALARRAQNLFGEQDRGGGG